jgi:hypothetical protein
MVLSKNVGDAEGEGEEDWSQQLWKNRSFEGRKRPFLGPQKKPGPKKTTFLPKVRHKV